MARDDRRHAVTRRRRPGEGRERSRSWPSLAPSRGRRHDRATSSPRRRAGRHVREYWVAAVPVTWNVVPNGRDAIEGDTFDAVRDDVPDRRLPPVHAGLGAKPIPNAPGDRGIQGPLLRARVGDTILVHFKNLDTAFNRPHSMHFHGVHYRPGSDGAYIPGFSGPGANVKPGETFTYRLVAGPDSAGVWPYHDHSPSMMDSIAGGLYGALSILAPGEQPPDHEFVVFLESHLGFMTINGRAFVGNTPVFHAQGRRRRPVGRARARRRLPHLPRPRPPLADPDGATRRHADGRPGRELQDPLARGRAGHVALPLPRREPHDERDDRHLPGDRDEQGRAVSRWRSSAASLAAAAAVERGRRRHARCRSRARSTRPAGSTCSSATP